jgi:hypothetical protein
VPEESLRSKDLTQFDYKKAGSTMALPFLVSYSKLSAKRSGPMKTQGIVKRPSYVMAELAGMLATICFLIVGSAIIASASRYNITDLDTKESLMSPSKHFSNTDQWDGGYAIADDAWRAFPREGMKTDPDNMIKEASSPTLYPSAINDAAQVSDYGKLDVQHPAFLWMPVAIMLAILPFGSGLACLILLRKRLVK